MLGHFWVTFAILLGYFWNTFGILLEYFLYTFEIFLRYFWDTFLMVLVYFYNTFEILFGYFWDFFGMTIGYFVDWTVFNNFQPFWTNFNCFKCLSSLNNNWIWGMTKCMQICNKFFWVLTGIRPKNLQIIKFTWLNNWTLKSNSKSSALIALALFPL